MRIAQEFLRRLTELLPPPSGSRHGLVIEANKLSVVLFLEGAWESYVIEEGDLEKDVDTLVSEVVALRAQRQP